MNYLVLCEGFDFRQSLEMFCTAILSVPKLIIMDSTFTIVDVSWAFTSWSFAIFLGERVITFISCPFAAGCRHQVNYGMVQTLVMHPEILGTSGQEDKAAFELGAQHQSVPIQVR